MKKERIVEPPDDIPSWFMTYSDVITLLMTFFILLLTFSTTEPEKYERITAAFMGVSGSTGVAGHENDGLERDSWSERMRPRAARIAMQGSEMPPIVDEIPEESAGRGLEVPEEEDAKKDIMRTYFFDMPIKEVVNKNNHLTQRGMLVAAKLAGQLKSLPVHCAIELRTDEEPARVAAFADYLYEVEHTRPGQVAVGFVDQIESDTIRFVIERFEQ